MSFDFDRYERNDSAKKAIKSIGIWIVQIVAVILLAYLFVNYGVQKISIIGDSMGPALIEGDSVVVNKMIYHVTHPKRNDVVVFSQEGRAHSYYNVKRVIGLPGETIRIQDGLVYINDEVLEETIEVELMENSGGASTAYTLEENEYFVLGDNRNDSVDSRYSSIGIVLKGNIIGKAWIRVNEFSFVSSLNLKIETETEIETEQ